MHWTRQLRNAVRATVKAAGEGSTNVEAPVNIKRAINVNRPGSDTAASAKQHVEIQQSTRDSQSTSSEG